MKNNIKNYRIIFLVTLFAIKAFAYKRVIIEPLQSKDEAYILATDFKLKDYNESGNTSLNRRQPKLRIDLDTMTFAMVEVNEDGLAMPSNQIVAFGNTNGAYMTCTEQGSIRMEIETPENKEMQKWHPIYIEKDNNYMFEYIEPTKHTNQNSSSNQNPNNIKQVSNNFSSPLIKKCAGVAQLETKSRSNISPVKTESTNIQVMNCDLLNQAQRFIMKEIDSVVDQKPGFGNSLNSNIQDNSIIADYIGKKIEDIINIQMANSQMLMHIQEILTGTPPTPLNIMQNGVANSNDPYRNIGHSIDSDIVQNLNRFGNSSNYSSSQFPGRLNNSTMGTYSGDSFLGRPSNSTMGTYLGDSFPGRPSNNIMGTYPGDSFSGRPSNSTMGTYPGDSFPGRPSNSTMRTYPGDSFPDRPSNSTMRTYPGDSFPGRPNSNTVENYPGGPSISPHIDSITEHNSLDNPSYTPYLNNNSKSSIVDSDWRQNRPSLLAQQKTMVDMYPRKPNPTNPTINSLH